MEKLNTLVPRISVVIWLALLLLGVSGCNSLEITSRYQSAFQRPIGDKAIVVLWVDNYLAGQAPNKILNTLTSSLKSLGYNTILASEKYGNRAFANMEKPVALQMLRDSGYDVVIALALVDKNIERRYIPEAQFYPPYGDYYNRFLVERNHFYDEIYQPHYYMIDTDLVWECSINDLAMQKMVYALQVRSDVALTSQKDADAFVLIIINDLLQHNLLQNKHQQPLSYIPLTVN